MSLIVESSLPPEASPVQRSLDWYREFHTFLLSVPQLKGFADLLGGDAPVTMSAGALYQLHAKAINFFHVKLDPRLSDAFTQVIAAFAERRGGGLGLPNEASSPAVLRAAQELHSAGYTQLSPLDGTWTDTLRRYFEACPLVAPNDLNKPRQEQTLRDLADIRQDCNLANVPRAQVMQAPGLFDLLTDPEVLETVQRVLGAPPILTDVSAWRSFAGEDGAKPAKDAQLFHVDLDNYRFVKVFHYLTDVDDESGPHVFVPETHRYDRIAAAQPPDGTEARQAFDRWYFGAMRKTEEEVRHWFGTDPVFLKGPAGTRLIVSTQGIHRGAPPISRDRWVLQFVFGTAPATVWMDAGLPPRRLDRHGASARTATAREDYALQLLMPNVRR